jgi:hypothetical protein
LALVDDVSLLTLLSKKSSPKLNDAGGVIPKPMDGREFGSDVPSDEP